VEIAWCSFRSVQTQRMMVMVMGDCDGGEDDNDASTATTALYVVAKCHNVHVCLWAVLA